MGWVTFYRFLTIFSIVFVCFAVEGWTDNWKSHKPKTLTTQRLQRVADMSDMTTFKRDELQPMLKVRVSGTPENVEVQEHIKKRMSNLGWTVNEDRFTDTTPYGKKEFNNIIATLDPEAKRQLVLACHFDSKYFAPPRRFIAAIDSAVPCAMLLDMARLLDKALKKPYGTAANDVTLQFMFFDGEEAFREWTNTDSIYGSRHLAKAMKETPHPHDANVSILKGIDAFILLDLLGAKNPSIQNWFDDTTHLFERIQSIEKRLGERNNLKEHSEVYFKSRIRALEDSNYYKHGIEDDHRPFQAEGVPIVHVIPTPFPHVWHKDTDIEKELHYNTIDNLNKIFRVLVAEYLHLSV